MARCGRKSIGGIADSEIVGDCFAEDLPYLIKNEHGDIVVDTEKKQAHIKTKNANVRISDLKLELIKVKEDIEQVEFGLVRDDYEANKLRACELINAIRVLEGKEAREIVANEKSDTEAPPVDDNADD